MAHIFAIAPTVKGYTEGRLTKPGEATRFPETYVFSGINKPSRLEGDVFDLEVTGTIPKDINATFYRIQPDQRFPPLFEDDIHFNGDGSVTAIGIANGHADFKQRYVQTDRYKAETAARRSLFGRYRNPFTDNESVKGVIRTASNTNITFWRGMLLATKEDGPPFAMDPVTLETLGRYDFEGQITAPTFTAHPKFDPDTGEMICYAYEAGGNGNDGSLDIIMWTIDKDGKKTEEAFYKAPFAGMIHDIGVSENYVVMPLTPIKVNMDRMRKGGEVSTVLLLLRFPGLGISECSGTCHFSTRVKVLTLGRNLHGTHMRTNGMVLFRDEEKTRRLYGSERTTVRHFLLRGRGLIASDGCSACPS